MPEDLQEARQPGTNSVSDPRQENAFAVARLAKDLLVASYSAGVVLVGEDVRQVVRIARLFYDEVEHPTEEKKPKGPNEDDEVEEDGE